MGPIASDRRRHGHLDRCHARLVSPATVPRVQRSFAFVDLCGFTDFAEANGDDEASQVLHLLRASVREAATNHGVRVDKWLGDGAMIIGVEPPSLLAAVVEMKWALAAEGAVPLRAGIAAGRVMVFEGDDYVGRVINLAAKLCELAGPNQCLAPADLTSMCPAGVEATAVGSRTVPGFHEPIPIVAIDASSDEVGSHRRGLGAALGRTVRHDGASQQRPASASADEPA
jgi:adenylate cyclase